MKKIDFMIFRLYVCNKNGDVSKFLKWLFLKRIYISQAYVFLESKLKVVVDQYFTAELDTDGNKEKLK